MKGAAWERNLKSGGKNEKNEKNEKSEKNEKVRNKV